MGWERSAHPATLAKVVVMNLLFPQNPLMRRLPEPIFEPEFDAAKSLGFACLLYAEVSYFPNYYLKIREFTPAAIWSDAPDSYLAWSLDRELGDGPFVIKDHIKSAKHLWHDACFVPKGSGRENFERIAENLKKEQGKSFFRGFVVKQYVPLRSRGESPREYPMCEEYRLFFWKRQLLMASHYHRLFENPVDWSPFINLAQRFDAPFFTMDVAQAESNEWIVVDVGAGECSSLPPGVEPMQFYRKLAELLGSEAGPGQVPSPT